LGLVHARRKIRIKWLFYQLLKFEEDCKMNEYTMDIVKDNFINKFKEIPKTPFVVEVASVKYFIFVNATDDQLYHCAGIDGKYYCTYSKEDFLKILNNDDDIKWELRKSRLIIE
jgi:hypothetical protein